MSNTTGVVFLVVAAAGGIYLYNISSKLSPTAMKERKKPSVYARAENASESQIVASNVREAAAPTLEGGIKNSGRMLERVVSTRLAESWRNSELPGLQFGHSNAPLDEMLVRAQSATKHVYVGTMDKLNYMFDPDRQRPIIQGRIRNKFQTTNFVKSEA